jgi:hypothetical protein
MNGKLTVGPETRLVGKLTVVDDKNIAAGKSILSKGRLHIAPDEL